MVLVIVLAKTIVDYLVVPYLKSGFENTTKPYQANFKILKVQTIEVTMCQ